MHICSTIGDFGDIFIESFTGLVSRTSHILPRQIANAHTIFNLANAMVITIF